jgi:hypothetical protein
VVQEGSVNAISLKDHNGRLEWDSIVNLGQGQFSYNLVPL